MTRPPLPSIAERITAGRGAATFGVFVGRLCPMHLGHQAVIDGLVQAFGQKHVVLIGSCNHAISIRHLFSYGDRAEFVRSVFPDARVAPLPDFEDGNENWFRALDDTIALAGADPAQTVFVGGCREDVEFFYENGRQVHIVSRYGGDTVNISASEIRDALITGRPTAGMLDDRVAALVTSRFPARWATVRSR